MKSLKVKRAVETSGAKLSLIGVPERYQKEGPSLRSFPSRFNPKAHHIWKECLNKYDYSILPIDKQWESIVEHYLDECEMNAIAPFQDTPDVSDNKRIIEALSKARLKLVDFFKESNLFSILTLYYKGTTYENSANEFKLTSYGKISGFGSKSNLVKYLTNTFEFKTMPRGLVLPLSTTTKIHITDITDTSALISYSVRVETSVFHPDMHSRMVNDEEMDKFIDTYIWQPIVRTRKIPGLKTSLF